MNDAPPFQVGDLVRTTYHDSTASADPEEEAARVRRVTHIRKDPHCGSGWAVRADTGGGERDVPLASEQVGIGRGVRPWRGVDAGWFTKAGVAGQVDAEEQERL